MDASNIKKKFPIDFPEKLLPPGAKEQCIRVFRVCRTGSVEPDSFLPSHKDPLFKVRDREAFKNRCDYYSVSTYEDLDELKQKTRTFIRHTPAQIYAVGFTAPECGPSQKSKDREGANPQTTHVDWWLYENATPHIHFKPLDDK